MMPAHQLPRRRTPVAEIVLLSGHLIRQRALAARRDWSSRTVYLVAAIAGTVLFSLILAGSYLGARTLTEARAEALLWSIPPWAFLVYLFTDIFIAFGQALGDLYLADDMPVLIAMPLRISSIVVAKFVSGVVQNEVYVAAFLAPFVIGFLAGTHAGLWSYPLALAGVGLFPALIYAVLAAVTILALRFIPAERAKESLWLIGAIVPVAFWVASFSGLARAGGDLSTLRLPPAPAWMPSTWVGDLVSSLARGNVPVALVWFAFLLVATLAVCPAALAFISRAFSAGWSGSLAVAPRGAGASMHPPAQAAPWVAIFRKDAWLFVRTPQLWFGHITSLGFVAYLLVGHRVQSPLLPLTIQLAMTQIGFVALLAGLNPGMTALSLEHAAIWLLRSMPLRARDILAGKAVVALAQTGIVICFGAAALGYGYGFGLAATCALVAFALVMACVSVCFGLGFDTAFPSFSWDNPNAINRGIRMILPFINSLAVLLVCAAMLGAARVVLHGPRGVVVGLLLCVLLAAWLCASVLRASVRRIEALEV